MPTLDDEQALEPGVTADELCQRLPSHEVVIKLGAEGCLVRNADGLKRIEVPEALTPKDTTAAGDSFNAAYLAVRLGGATLEDAALRAHTLAGAVIRHAGAIIPKDAMPPL